MEIANLEVKITSDAEKAAKALDNLAASAKRLKSAVNINTSKLEGLSRLTNISFDGFSDSVGRLGENLARFSESTRSFGGVDTKAFNRLKKGIEKISSIDASALQNVSNNILPLAEAMRGLGSVSFDNRNLTSAINSIARLGSVDVSGFNAEGLSRVGESISELAQNLAGAPEVSQKVIGLTNAVARLAAAGEKTEASAKALPTLSRNLKELIKNLHGAASVQEGTISLTQGIAQLANAGSKAKTTASALDELADRTRHFIEVLSEAPNVSAGTERLVNSIAQIASAGRQANGAFRNLSNMGAGNVSVFGRLKKSLSGLIPHFGKTKKASVGLSGSLGKLIAVAGSVGFAISKIRDAIEIASDLTEVQNVVDVSFGDMSKKVEEFAQNSIEQFGMSELAVKTYASRFQAMGNALGISTGLISDANSFLSKQTDGYVEMSDSLSDVSLNLTKLTADMASFYNVEQEAVAKDLESVFTGMVVPLRQYGLDLTIKFVVAA